MAVTTKIGTLKGKGTDRCTLVVVDDADGNREYFIPNFNNLPGVTTVKEAVEAEIARQKAAGTKSDAELAVDATLSDVDPSKL